LKPLIVGDGTGDENYASPVGILCSYGEAAGATVRFLRGIEMTDPLVTVIIPTYNSERAFGQCLAALTNQSYRNIETIVVDNHSSDRTLGMITGAGVRVIAVKSSMSEARNIGAAQSKGHYLFHIDSDMELSPDVIEECVRSCTSNHADAVIVPEISAGQGYWAECLALGKTLVLGAKGHEGVRFVARDAFQQVGGYDTKLVAGEDFDFFRRLVAANFRISRISSTIRHHVGAVTLRRMLAKYSLYGQTIDAYRMKYADQPSDAISIVKLVSERWRTLAGDPFHAVGYAFLLLVAYIIQR